MKPKPIETAPKKKGQKILAYCDAAESESGWQEMQWTGKQWWYVISHDWPNMCPHPTHWLPVPATPR